MTASPDDAAASSLPPRADGGPAVSSFPGTPGRRSPEDSAMPQRPTLSDDRMADDTRPVTRDWLLGAPDADPPPSPAASEDDWSTQAFDRTPAEDSPVADPEVDETAALGAVPAEQGDGHREELSSGHDGGDDGADTPAGPPPGDEPPADGPRAPWWRQRAVLVPAGAVAVLAALYGVDLLVSSGDIPRSTVVAGVDIGGL